MSMVTSQSTLFTAAEFERMCDAGVFGSRRVELIDGRIYRVPAQKDPHMFSLSKSDVAFKAAARSGDWVLNQGTLRVDENTTVDPDLLWLPNPMGTPFREWRDPVLLLEVAETTYRKDSGRKLRKYAKLGIRDYWIVNVKADRVEVYRDPLNPTGNVDDCCYATVTHHARGETIASLVRPEATFRVDDLLP